jgi:hypothetical protein
MDTDNVYYKIASKLSDDELLKSIAHPEDVELEFFDALVYLAKERKLEIENPKAYSVEEIPEETTEIETENNSQKTTNEPSLSTSEVDWQCPQCKFMIGQEFDICWNCNFDRTQFLEIEREAKIIEQKKESDPKSYGKSGLKLMGLGALIIVLTYFRFMTAYFHNYHFEGYIVGGLAILLGLVFFVISIADRNNK